MPYRSTASTCTASRRSQQAWHKPLFAVRLRGCEQLRHTSCGSSRRGSGGVAGLGCGCLSHLRWHALHQPRAWVGLSQLGTEHVSIAHHHTGGTRAGTTRATSTPGVPQSRPAPPIRSPARSPCTRRPAPAPTPTPQARHPQSGRPSGGPARLGSQPASRRSGTGHHSGHAAPPSTHPPTRPPTHTPPSTATAGTPHPAQSPATRPDTAPPSTGPPAPRQSPQPHPSTCR